MLLIKEIEKDINKLKDTPFHGLEELRVLKMPILPRRIYRFNALCIKIPKALFTETEKAILKLL